MAVDGIVIIESSGLGERPKGEDGAGDQSEGNGDEQNTNDGHAEERHGEDCENEPLEEVHGHRENQSVNGDDNEISREETVVQYDQSDEDDRNGPLEEEKV